MFFDQNEVVRLPCNDPRIFQLGIEGQIKKLVRPKVQRILLQKFLSRLFCFIPLRNFQRTSQKLLEGPYKTKVSAQLTNGPFGGGRSRATANLDHQSVGLWTQVRCWERLFLGVVKTIVGALHCGVLLLRFFQFVILSRSVIAYAIPKRCQETRNGTKFEKRLTFTDGVETRATGAKGG